MHHTLQTDIGALLSIYNDKQGWYKEGSESSRKQLPKVHYEFFGGKHKVVTGGAEGCGCLFGEYEYKSGRANWML